MTSSRCPERRRRWLRLAWLGLALGAAGAAQPLEAACDAPPTLRDVWVGASLRGAFPVLQLGEQTWIPADALTDSEQDYASARAECRGVPYLRLAAGLQVSADDEELTLTIRPAPGLLPGNVLDFAAALPDDTLPLSPLFAVTARAQLSGTLAPPTEGAAHRQQLDLGLLYALGRWNLGADLTGRRVGAAPFAVSGQIQAGYHLSRTWRLRATLNSGRLAPALAGTGAPAFSGLELSGQSGRGIVLPQFTLSLPLDSDVTLAIDDQVLRTFRARAGTLVVRNLPLPRQQGELLIDIRDLSGARRQVLPFQNLSATLGTRAYQFSTRVGVAEGGWVGDLSAYYGLSPQLALRVLGTVRGPAAPTASVTALYSTPGGQVRAGVGMQAAAAGTGGPEWVATAGYGLSRGRWTAGLDATVPFGRPSPQLQASVGYTTDRLNLGVSASYAAATSAWSLGASGTARLSQAVQLTAQATATGAGWRAGLGVVWIPSPQFSAVAGGTLTRPGGGAPEPALNVSYQASPSTTLRLSAERGAASVGAEYTGALELSAQLSSAGRYALDTSASAVFAGGHVRLAPGVSDGSLLVRTGIAGLTLVLDGAQRQVTDRRGDALFSGLTPGEVSTVSVDFDRLDVTTQVRDDRRDVVAAGLGLSVLDWTQNFRQVRWLQLFWASGVPAAFAALSGWPEDAGPALSDDQGNVQLTRLDAAREATLTGEDGRSCRLRIVPGEESATCLTAP